MIKDFPNIPSSKKCGDVFKGAGNKREITDKSYVEYCSIDDAREALKSLKDKPFSTGSKTILIKAALSKINLTRNWALRKAKEVVTDFAKGSTEHKNAEVEIIWKERCVKIGTEKLFIQLRDELKGSFHGIAVHLKLP